MRKTAKALDDRCMSACIVYEAFQVSILFEKAKQAERALLIGERFAVLEREVEKYPRQGRNLIIKSRRNGRFCTSQRFGVAGEALRRGAKHVARELIE